MSYESGGLVIGAPTQNQEVTEVETPAVENEVVEEVEQDQEVDDQEAEAPAKTGWLEHDEYIAQGGDPEMYRGKKAFDQFGDEKQKGRDKEAAAYDKMERLIEMQQDQLTKAQDKARSEERALIESNLKQAREDLDPDAIQKKTIELHQHDQETKHNQNGTKPHPIYAAFQDKNPMLDPSSPSYSEPLRTLFTAAVEKELRTATNSGARQATDYELQNIFKNAMSSTKPSLPHLFKPTAPARRAPPSSKPGGRKPTADPIANLGAAEKEMYNHLVSKGRQKAATNFAKSMAKK